MVLYPTDIDLWTDVTDEVSVISAVHMNEAHNQIIQVEQEQINFRSRFSAYRSGSTFQCNTGALTLVEFNSELFDLYGEYSHDSTYFFVPIKTGYYLIGCSLSWTSWTVGQYCSMFIYNGASAVVREIFWPTQADHWQVHFSKILFITALDEIQIKVWQASGTNYQINTGEDNTFFYGHRIS